MLLQSPVSESLAKTSKDHLEGLGERALAKVIVEDVPEVERTIRRHDSVSKGGFKTTQNGIPKNWITLKERSNQISTP